MVMKQELCCKRYSRKARLKLFDVVITPTILYASGTWTMSAYREMLLSGTQRKMLRKIIGLGRIRPEQAASDEDDENDDAYDGAEKQNEGNDSNEEEGETWVDRIRRVTKIAEEEARKTKVTDWIQNRGKESGGGLVIS